VTDPDNSRDSVGRTEWLLVAVITIVGGVLRFYGLGDEGLSHYDEGVYVLWAMGLDFPAKELFAPPLFPLVLRAVFALFGPSDLLAQAVSALVGTATLPLVWRVGRRWFGQLAGLCVLSLAASSGLHVAFSRTALTDVSFTFWFVLAVWLASELVRRSSEPTGAAKSVWAPAVALGLAAGAAMNTKYNGLLTLAVSSVPFLLEAACGRVNRRLASGLLVAALVAAAMYVPWVVHVSRTVDGGYAGLLRHHRGYSTSLSTWPQNLSTLMLGHAYLSTRAFQGVAAATLTVGGWVLAYRQGLAAEYRALAALGGFALGYALTGPAAWLVGLVFVGIELRNRRTCGVLLFVWLGVFLILTPMYRPYARLLLPLEAATWIACGGFVASLVHAERKNLSLLYWPASATALAVFAGWLTAMSVSLQQPSRKLGRLAGAAAAIAQSIPDRTRVATFVRPPALFYVAHKPVEPVADLDWLARPGARGEPKYLLIDEALLRDNPQAARRTAESRGMLRELRHVLYSPSAVVRLDDAGAGLEQITPDYSLRLYHIDRDAVSRETR
jgi:4-amino-4-deoxy-L-arabinose transferase-like glycosyltransferase